MIADFKSKLPETSNYVKALILQINKKLVPKSVLVPRHYASHNEISRDPESHRDYGTSFYENRRVLDYHGDIRALTEHLGLEKYCILGTSGGTGYTLACAQHLPKNNLAAVGICAGMGPWEAGLKGQSIMNRTVMQI